MLSSPPFSSPSPFSSSKLSSTSNEELGFCKMRVAQRCRRAVCLRAKTFGSSADAQRWMSDRASPSREEIESLLERRGRGKWHMIALVALEAARLVPDRAGGRLGSVMGS